MNRIENAAYLLGRLDTGTRQVKKQVRNKKTGKTHTQTYHIKDKEIINPVNGKPIGKMYSRLKPGSEPKKTRIAYKLMEVRPSRPGLLLPLYAKDPEGKQGFTVGHWYKAENQRPTIGKKPLAERPGIHAVGLPVFDQGKAKVKGSQRVWVEVEMPSITPHTQNESDNSQKLPNGSISGVTSRLIDPHESYDYKTNPSASTDAGTWPIAGSMKAVKILSDREVHTILNDNGLHHQIENSTTGIDDASAKLLNEQAIAVSKVMI